MMQALINSACRLLTNLNRSWFPQRFPLTEPAEAAPSPARPCERLKRVLLTDEVTRTLFDAYAVHRKGTRGEEETGWVLLGERDTREALVLATLPAGAERRAGVGHVWFNATAQALATRIVRQANRRLRMLGVLHTHPGSLRHPSDGDFEGDSQWVGQLRGGEGVFGIGTADAPVARGTEVARQPQAHMQCFGELRLCWYSLRQGERRYRPLDVAMTLGPDLARPLHQIWPTIERHAEALERLAQQQAGVKFDVVSGPQPALGVTFRLAGPGESLRLELHGEDKRYYVVRGHDVYKVDPQDKRVDRGVYLLLAELAPTGRGN